MALLCCRVLIQVFRTLIFYFDAVDSEVLLARSKYFRVAVIEEFLVDGEKLQQFKVRLTFFPELS